MNYNRFYFVVSATLSLLIITLYTCNYTSEANEETADTVEKVTIAIQKLQAKGAVIEIQKNDSKVEYAISIDILGEDLKSIWCGRSEDLELIAIIGDVVELDLRYSIINTHGLKFLERLPNLRYLRLLHPDLIDKTSLSYITKCNKLEELSLFGSISKESMKYLIKLKNLRVLRAIGNTINDESMIQIAQLSELRYLELPMSQISDQGLTKLQNLNNLEIVELVGSKLTDRSAETFTKLKNLKYLNVCNTSITNAGVNRIKTVNPKCVISWNENPIPRSNAQDDTRN